jgi:hypothetical protein
MVEQTGDKSPSLTGGVKKWLAFIPGDTSPRILLIYFSVLLQLIALAVSGTGYATGETIYWLTGMLIWILWFFIMFLIVIPRTDTLLQRYRGWLKPVAKTILIVLLIVGIAEGGILGVFAPGYIKSGASNDFVRALEEMSLGYKYNDGAALIQQAAENLLDGNNPYAHGNIVEAFIKYGGAYDRTTPLQMGSFAGVFPYPTREQFKQVWDAALINPSPPPPELESNVCYPAGSFLLVTPFIAAGIKDIRIIYSIFVIAGLIYATWRIPVSRRPIFIGIVLISLEIWNGLAIGETSTMIFPFLLIAWITLGKNNWLSAIFMGLAVASKQTAWFFLPFYLILLWRTSPPKTVAAAIGIIAAIFFSFNIYFIINDPAIWLQSIASPMAEPMFPLGVGIISLVTGGLINVQTSLLFTIMEVVVLIIGIVWYVRSCLKYPEAGLILAVLPLFFAWRSLWTYFFYVAVIILARMLTKEPEQSHGLESVNPRLPLKKGL